MEDKKTCDKCNGACCRYVILEIDCPESLDEFENIKWYVAHEKVRVFVDEDYTWNIEFSTPCTNLNENNQCKIYDSKPEICNSFSANECSFHGNYTEKYSFNCIKDVENYIENIFEKELHILPNEEEEDDEDEDEE